MKLHNQRKRKYVLRAIAGIQDCGVYIVVPTLELVSSVLFTIAKAYTMKQ